MATFLNYDALAWMERAGNQGHGHGNDNYDTSKSHKHISLPTYVDVTKCIILYNSRIKVIKYNGWYQSTIVFDWCKNVHLRWSNRLLLKYTTIAINITGIESR